MAVAFPSKTAAVSICYTATCIKILLRIVLAVWIATFLNSEVRAEKTARLPAPTFDDVLNLKDASISGVQWISDDTLVGDEHRPAMGQRATIAMPIDGKERYDLSNGSMSSVSPNGDMIAQRVSGDWVIRNLKTNIISKVEFTNEDKTFSGLSQSAPAWSRDGKFISFSHARKVNEHTINRTISEKNGVRFVDIGADVDSRPKMQTDIHIFDLDTLETPIKTISVEGVVRTFDWGPDSSLFFVQNKYYDYREDEAHTVLFQLKMNEREPVQVYRTTGLFQGMLPKVSPDGRWIAIAIDVENRVWNDFLSLVVLDTSDFKERRLTTSGRVVRSSYVWSSDSREIFYLVRTGGYSEIHKTDLDGRTLTLADGERRYRSLSISPNGKKISYQTEDGYGRRDVRVKDLVTGEESIVYSLSDPTYKFLLGSFHRVSWPNEQGDVLRGFLIKPANFSEGKQYPLLVDVHGGGPGARLNLRAPISISISPGPLEWHVWSALGYVVFIPDFRSSGDYGAHTVTERYASGDFAGVAADIHDIELGTKHIVSKGFIDSKKIAVLGHSAGGARVQALLTRNNNLFSAAILNEAAPPDALSSFVSFTTGASTGRFFRSTFGPMLGGSLGNKPERYLRNFVFDSYKVKTPTLILVGGDESRYPAPAIASEMLFSILRQYNVPTRMIRFEDEGHTYTNPEAAKIAFIEIRNWLDQHLNRNLTEESYK